MAERIMESSSTECSTCDKLIGKSHPKPVEMESILNALGAVGRYQVSQIFFTTVCVIPFGFVMLNFIFIGFEPPHSCHPVNETKLLAQHGLLNDSTATVRYGQCFINVNSNRTGRQETPDSLGCIGGYNYIGGKHVSMVTEWDLVCDKRGIVQLVQTMFTLGMAVGSVFSTSLADRYGRKKVYILVSVVATILEASVAYAQNIYVVIALRFFTGVSIISMYLIHYVLSVELVISKHRQPYGMGHCMLWSSSIMLLAGTAFLFRNQDWRHFQLMVPVSCVPVFIFVYFLNESPSWLLAKGRFGDAKRVLKQACKTNGRDVMMIMDMFDQIVERTQHQQKHGEDGENEKSFKGAKYTIVDLFRNKKMLVPVSVLSLTWFTISLVYYGIYLTSSAIAGNRFLNFFLMAALEIPATSIAVTMLLYLGRRTVLQIFFGLSVCFLLVSTILVALKSDNDDTYRAKASTAFFLLGKFAIGAGFNVTFTYTPEIFPTTIRSCGLGVCSSLARVAGMIAPFMGFLFKMLPWLPGTLLTALCFVSFICLILLPETRGKRLPITMEDFIAMKNNSVQVNKRKTKNGPI